MLGPGADVAGEGDSAVAGVHLDVTIIVDERVPVQRALDEPCRIGGLDVAEDLDVVRNVADARQARDGLLCTLVTP